MVFFHNINRRIIGRLQARWAELPRDVQRERLGVVEGRLSILLNFVLFVLKLIAGIFTGSLAVISDAFHSISDCLTSLVVIVGFRFSHRDADRKHPFGHGRVEHISTLIIAILLIIAGLELARANFLRLLEPQVLEIGNWVLGVLILTILVKEGLSDLSQQLGEVIDSDALRADARHHRLDELSTGLVVAALALQRFGLPAMDAAVGLLVALLVSWSGVSIARNTVDRLLGKAPEPELLNSIMEAVQSVKDVIDVHGIIVHDYGMNRYVSLHVEVDQEFSLTEGHDIAEEVERSVTAAAGAHVTVHLDPIDTSDELRNSIAAQIESEFEHLSAVQYHDLRLARAGEKVKVSVALVYPPGFPQDQIDAEGKLFEQRLRRTFPLIGELNLLMRQRHHE